MQNLPHIYNTQANGGSENLIHLSSGDKQSLNISAPIEFGGTNDHWNPEALFCASISTCFILTFRAVSRAMNLKWIELKVDTNAILDMEDKKLAFTNIVITTDLTITGADYINRDKFTKALEKAKGNCLVTNSIKSAIELNIRISNN